ncbi:hypothetical protein QIA01_05050 (plasmid) [Borreliella americana]
MVPIDDFGCEINYSFNGLALELFQRPRKSQNQSNQKKQDGNLKELEKQSEIALMKLKENFDTEIKMRKEKLDELDDEYTKEIEFLKQAQSKGQISDKEFQKRLYDV